jgi:hypothetical protein
LPTSASAGAPTRVIPLQELQTFIDRATSGVDERKINETSGSICSSAAMSGEYA